LLAAASVAHFSSSASASPFLSSQRSTITYSHRWMAGAIVVGRPAGGGTCFSFFFNVVYLSNALVEPASQQLLLLPSSTIMAKYRNKYIAPPPLPSPTLMTELLLLSLLYMYVRTFASTPHMMNGY
jgi:hypothetical protein